MWIGIIFYKCGGLAWALVYSKFILLKLALVDYWPDPHKSPHLYLQCTNPQSVWGIYDIIDQDDFYGAGDAKIAGRTGLSYAAYSLLLLPSPTYNYVFLPFTTPPFFLTQILQKGRWQNTAELSKKPTVANFCWGTFRNFLWATCQGRYMIQSIAFPYAGIPTLRSFDDHWIKNAPSHHPKTSTGWKVWCREPTLSPPSTGSNFPSEREKQRAWLRFPDTAFLLGDPIT